MKKMISFLGAAAILFAACTSSSPSTPLPVRTKRPTRLPPTAPAPTASTVKPTKPPLPTAASTQGSPFQPSTSFSAQVHSGDNVLVTTLFSSSCVEVVTTPLVVGEYIVFGVNKRTPKPGESNSPYAGCESDPAEPGVYAVSAVTGQAYALLQDINVEGTPTMAGDTLIVPLVGNRGGIFWWQAGEGNLTHPLDTGIDSAGLWDTDLGAYVVGSVNTPLPLCQNGPNADCGALIATTPQETILARLDRTDGLRGWTTAGPTGEGGFFYFGNGSGIDGAAEPAGNRLHACSVLKIDRNFHILAAYDDGAPGCTAIGRLESAVVGEVPVVDGVLWAQYLGSTDGSPSAPVVRLNAADLTPLCRAELPIIPSRSATGFYRAPVVDEQGNAYVTSAYPENGMRLSLYRIAPDCSPTRLYDTASTIASTPTLADDRWVLVAEAGLLHLIDRQSGTAQDISLPVADDIRAGVVLGENGVTVVTLHGTVITLTDSGLQDYGSAPWPRFRKDNLGSAQ